MEPIYPFTEIEQRWQALWHERGLFAFDDTAANTRSRPCWYVLEMFPYPSGELHVGHMRNYTMGDVISRFKRAQGYNVLHPMGWDAFGLPAENAALEFHIHPETWTRDNIAAMRRQFQRIGMSFDWSRELATCDADYIAQQQKIFLLFLQNGIATRQKSFVNWDPVEQTVLANEQVINGSGWRSGAPIQMRELEQWTFAVSRYAAELDSALADLTQWPEQVLLMQKNWIGKSHGAEIDFHLTQASLQLLADTVGSHFANGITVFSTRQDTLFGAQFCALSANHPLAQVLAEHDADLATYIAQCRQTSTQRDGHAQRDISGYLTGLNVVHPLDSDRTLPVYVANYVLAEYGTGAIFGCPGHDQRDLDFCRAYGLPVVPVVAPPEQADNFTITEQAYLGDGLMINSAELNGMTPQQAREAVNAKLEAQGSGRSKVTFRLRDWGVSRQRYWGCPIPVIHCRSCGIVPVPETELPLLLPADATFDRPGNPLEYHPTWKHTTCPTCHAPAVRETDTLDTFVDSSWYFARFIDPKNTQICFEKSRVDATLPVNNYIGGIEHAVLHLLYSRFFMRALGTCGLTTIDEPFAGLFTQGMVCHATYQSADGKWVSPNDVILNGTEAMHKHTHESIRIGPSIKMSKSKKNVVSPMTIIDQYGADTARLFVLSDSPPERNMEWTTAGVEGVCRFLNRVWRELSDSRQLLQSAAYPPQDCGTQSETDRLKRILHKTINAVTHDFDAFAFNRSVARLREFSHVLFAQRAQLARAQTDPSVPAPSLDAFAQALQVFLQLANPMVPHLTEALWDELKALPWYATQDCLAELSWPQADPRYLHEATITIAIQVNGKLRATLDVPEDCSEAELERQAKTLPAIDKYLDQKTLRKRVYVPKKLLNYVV